MRKTILPALLAWLCCATALAQQAPAPIVNVGYYEFPPYSWTGDDGVPRGSILALTERLLRHAGYRGRYRSLPNARLYAELREGSVQLWPGAGGKAELAGYTYEARHVMGDFSLALYTRPGLPAPRLPDDLRGKGLILISGYSYWPAVNEMLADPALQLTLHRTSNHLSALEMLLRQRGDYLLDYHGPVEQARQTLGLAPLPHTTLQSLQLRLIASRNAAGSAELLEALDRAYEELQAAGEDLELD
ncbi:MAG: bifunctional lytic transglycosylase/amino acid ABC transporter substrate-binding protein [Pseudomonadaceae bacterium]|nr:bifunctional lytic transglycosylase/amino acid ABC transporter substrate-binding protein [Pseudomonadaceae bacterium]